MAGVEHFMVPDLLDTGGTFTHVTRVGERIWVSGCVGMRADGSIPADVVDQCEVTLDNLRVCLEAAGGSFDTVAKVTVFLTDIGDRAKIAPLRKVTFGETPPASTLVEVSALVHPDMKIEIEAEAVVAS